MVLDFNSNLCYTDAYRYQIQLAPIKRVDIVYYINILDDTLKTDPNSGFFCTFNGI